MLYFTSLPGVTIILQVHHHTVLHVSARGHNHSTRTSPFCALRLYPRSQSLYKYITILYFASLSGVTILLQLHHHTVLYVTARGHNPFTSASPCCTLRFCPGSQCFHKYITIVHLMSLPGFTIPLQVHHHTVLYVSARGHNKFCKYISIMYFTSLPGVTILLQVYNHTVFYVSVRWVTILLQLNHHPVLYGCARGHNPSKSTSPSSTLRLYPGSQFFYKYINILYFTSLPGVTNPRQVHHHTVRYVSARGHNPSTSI